MSYEIQGKLITADMYGVDKHTLDNHDFLVEKLCEAAAIAGATVLKSDSVKFKPNGVTVACILSESHITCHTYPDEGFIAIDCYTCGAKCQPEKAIEYLELVLWPKEGTEKHIILRGMKEK